MRLTTYFKPVNHFTVRKRFCLISPIIFSVSALCLSILPRHTQRHPMQQPHWATFSSQNRILFVLLHLIIFEHCLLGFQCPFPHGASYIPVHPPTFLSNGAFSLAPSRRWIQLPLFWQYLCDTAEYPHSVLYWSGTRLLLAYLMHSMGTCTRQVFDMWKKPG